MTAARTAQAQGAGVSGVDIQAQSDADGITNADALTFAAALKTLQNVFGSGSGTFNSQVISNFNEAGSTGTGHANFVVKGNPANSSPGLACFETALEIGGALYDGPTGASAAIYFGVIGTKVGAVPCFSFLNSYGGVGGGTEHSIADLLANGDLNLGGNLHLAQLGGDGRITSAAGLYLTAAGAGSIYQWNQGSGDVSQWFSGVGGTQVMTLKSTGKLLLAGGLGIGNSAAATTPGSVVKKMEVFDAAGASLGFVPIYSAIT